nr:immunoglobulin heavy chain junction region [Mus musculus]
CARGGWLLPAMDYW